MNSGWIYVASLFFLTFVVCTVYTCARDASADLKGVTVKSLKRAGKLAGVLAALAVVVLILSEI